MPHFIDDYGVRIHYYEWRVPRPRAVIQLVHGVGEHAGRYAELVRVLNAAGFSVWADDHRGHGRTGFEQHGGDLSRIGRLGPGGLRAAVAATRQFTEIIRRSETGVPLVILGHSWGSFLAQMLVNQHPGDYDGVVLTGTAYRMPFFLDAGNLNRRHASPGGTPVDWLSRDPAVAAAFLADPLTTAVPLQRLFGPRDALRLYGRPARSLPPRLPVLIMVGSDDALGGERSARRLARAYRTRSGLADVRVLVYPGARHEVFNETNQAEVRTDLVAWCQQRFPG